MASILPAMFPTHIRYSALAISFNISVLIAGATPTAAAWLVEVTGNLYMPAYYLMVVAVIGLITGLYMKETANKPLRGATPAASDRSEAKELLQETYDNIEQKVEDINAQIAELKRKADPDRPASQAGLIGAEDKSHPFGWLFALNSTEIIRSAFYDNRV